MFASIEQLLKAVAHARRLAVIHFLSFRTEADIPNLADVMKVSYKTASYHLRLMVSAGLLQKAFRGKIVNFRLRSAPDSARLLKLILTFLRK